MIGFLKTKTGTNLLFIVGGILLTSHFVLGDYLRSHVIGYDLVRVALMVLTVGFLAFNRPHLGFWVAVLFALLLLRFFLGDFLEARTSWYGLVSFLLIGLAILIVVITEIGTFFKKN